MSSDLQNATRLPLAEPSPAEHNPARQAFLSVFGPYLAHGITVHSPALGRGLLVGLPYSTRWERAFADVRFENLPAGWDTYDLSAIKPVLYAAEDAAKILPLGALIEDLEYFAKKVDALRALGIALNLPEGSYVRKELNKPQPVKQEATYTTDENGKLYQPYDEPGECYCCTRTVNDGGKYCHECQAAGAGKEVPNTPIDEPYWANGDYCTRCKSLEWQTRYDVGCNICAGKEVPNAH